MDKIAFKDVIAEHLNRYQLIKVVGTEDQYDLVPVYGTVSQEGTPVRALELQSRTTSLLRVFLRATEAAGSALPSQAPTMRRRNSSRASWTRPAER